MLLECEFLRRLKPPILGVVMYDNGLHPTISELQVHTLPENCRLSAYFNGLRFSTEKP